MVDIKKPIKSRDLNTWNKRIYIQDRTLSCTKFKPGTKFHAYFVPKLNKLYLISSNNGERKVSGRKESNRSVIDMKSKDIMTLFQEYETLRINISKDIIIVEGKTNDETKICVIPKKLLNKDYNSDKVFKVISLFSGAGFLDLGFKQEGFEIVYALEKERDMCETYKYNIGNHIVQGLIEEIDIDTIPEADALIGGSPCQALTNANRTKRILDDPKNLLIRKYIEVAKNKKQLSVCLLENVPQLLTVGKKFVDEFKEELSDYEVSVQILTASNLGSAQNRKRAIVLASKVGKIVIEDNPIASRLKTVREAFKNLTEDTPNQLEVRESSENTINIMKQIKQGQNYNNVFGISRHSNSYRRLEYDKPSITITHAGKSLITHPVENRVISIREAARLFDVPDDFIFRGTKNNKYQMIANGVPVAMASYLAKEIKIKLIEEEIRRCRTA